MVYNPDPKPGRWILPLVVLGMILFTWVWVNRLAPPDASETTVEDVAASSASSVAASEEADDPEPDGEEVEVSSPTPSTILPPEIEVYLTNLSEDKAALAEIVDGLNQANDAWENRSETGVTFSDTEAAMVSISEQAVVFREAVELHRPPADVAGLPDAHERVFESANAVSEAADRTLAGLRAPDTGEQRREAIVAFRAAAASFEQQVDQISEIVLQGFGTS